MSTRNAGNVSVRFSVENAEAVRKALQDLGKDGEKALKQLDAAGKPVTRGMAAVAEAVNEAKGRWTDFAASAGPAGRVLMSMGAMGAAAAGGRRRGAL